MHARMHARTHARSTLYCIIVARRRGGQNAAEVKKGVRRTDGKNIVAEGYRRKRKGEKKIPLSYRERTRSSTAWHQDIRDFDRAARSTTAQSLFVSYPLLLLLLRVRHASSFLPRLSFHRSNFHISSRSSLFLSSSCSPGPIGPGPFSPLPIPSPSSSRIIFISSLSLLRYRIPISGPLGFTWRALMTSRNERVPSPSNKRLFHVPMLILRESSRLQFSFHLLSSSSVTLPSASRFFVPHIASTVYPYVRNKNTREKKCMHVYNISDILIYLILKQYTLLTLRPRRRILL